MNRLLPTIERETQIATVTRRISLGLLLVQTVLIIASTRWNSVTFDEMQHLPAGISYWHHGRFFAYHHNPPVTKLLYALPAVLSETPVDYSQYFYEPGSRHPDWLLGNAFMRANANRYQAVFMLCRIPAALIAVLGGWVMFRWASEMYGPLAGVLCQTLWTFDPMVLGHGGLVTPDVGAAVLGFAATYQFWKYLRDPKPASLVISAVLLGLAIGAKFSLLILPAVWAISAAMSIALRSRQEGSQKVGRYALDAAVLTFVSLLTLNTVFLYEGSGLPLGRMKFFSNALTVPVESIASEGIRTNRFYAEPWKWIPIPLPEQFVLGLDHQMYDMRPADAYLGGEVRKGGGWWYYYPYALLVKTPIGTLLLVGLALLQVAGDAVRRTRGWGRRAAREDGYEAAGDPGASGWVTDNMLVLLPIIVSMVMLCSNTVLNKHARYMLQVYPFAFLICGVLTKNAWGTSQRATLQVMAGALTMNIVSVAFVYPNYIAYFNEVAGGPRQGHQHLVDSNVDWGQGLVLLRRWLEREHPDQEVQLAYFGAVDPGIYGIRFQVPGVLDNSGDGGPRPGIHVISVNYIAGDSFPPMTPNGDRQRIPDGGYRFYQRLRPEAVIGNCLHVYNVTEGQADALRQSAGLLPRRDLENAVAPGASTDVRGVGTSATGNGVSE